ncbi:hypothetical protein, variant [Aphanomyces invadans]|nr:hypothetical protein, variant [Aphanomyces invadans]ETW03629.1 hypothetical protein, variant [Aphanomyces invadans]|eukprot:XP_008867858.1 hypothetical protein, variant [Aphanomyces invadans]
MPSDIPPSPIQDDQPATSLERIEDDNAEEGTPPPQHDVPEKNPTPVAQHEGFDGVVPNPPNPTSPPPTASSDRRKRPLDATTNSTTSTETTPSTSTPPETPSTEHSPPRKVRRSATPVRQYQPPVVTTNLRYLSQQALVAFEDKAKSTSNSVDDAAVTSATLTDVIRLHTEKVKQLQKVPSKKRQLPRLKDPCRPKCHWDLLLEEMAWMAADFTEERHWKRAAAWRFARDSCEAKCAEKKSQEQDKRKLARQVAVHISSFWRAMERIAARYQTRSSSTSLTFERHLSIAKDPSSPRQRGVADAILAFEWMRTGDNPRIRDVVIDLFDLSKRAREAMKKNSAVDSKYASLKLAQFQWNALQFMLALKQGGHNLILNDQLGTGKPYTVSLFLHALSRLEDEQTVPHLVVVPDAEVHKWVHYIKILHPHRRIQLYHGSSTERLRHRRAWDQEYMQALESANDVVPVYCCIVAHSVFIEDATAVFIPQPWHAIVIEDMGHTVDSPQAYTGLQNCSSRVVVCEMALDQWATDRTALWGEFLLKHTLETEWNVLEWDELNLAEAGSVQRMMKHAGMSFKDESSCLHIALRALTLGRLRNDMEAQLGKVEEQTVACNMTSSQLKYYNNAVTAFNSAADKDTLDHWLRFILRLRSVCNGVDVLQDFERLCVVDRVMLESCSAKLKIMMELLDRLVHQDNSRVVLYVQSDIMLPAVEYAVMNHLNIPCVRVTGSVSSQHRALTHFASTDSVRVAIISSRARTIGSNRAACVYGAQAVVVLDSDWDPVCDAKLRAAWHLLAVNGDLTVYRLYCENTIEASLLRVGSTVSEKLFGEMTPVECIASPLFKSDVCPSWWSASINVDMSMALLKAELLEKYCGNVENLEWFHLEAPLTTGGELDTEEHLLLSNSDELTPVEWYAVHLVQSLKEKQFPRSMPKVAKPDASATNDSSPVSFNEMVTARNRDKWKKESTASLFYDGNQPSCAVVQSLRLEGIHATYDVFESPEPVPGDVVLDTRDDQPFTVTFRARKPPSLASPTDKLKVSDLKPIKVKKAKVPGKVSVSDDALKRKAANIDGKKSTDYEGFPLPEPSAGFDDDGFWGDTNLDALDSVSWDDTSILGGIQVQGLPDPAPTKKLKTSAAAATSASNLLQRPRKQVAEASREGWSYVEEGLLKKLHDMYGPNWNLIAQILTRQAMVKRRSARQCQEKFQRLMMPNKDKPVKVKPLALSPAAVSSRVGLHTGGVLLKYPSTTFGIPPPSIRKNWVLKQPVQDHELRHFRSTMEAVLTSVKKQLTAPPIPIPLTSTAPHESHAAILATPALSPEEVINKSKLLATYQAVTVGNIAPASSFPDTSGLGGLEIPATTRVPPTPDAPAWGDLSLLHQNLTRAGAESASVMPTSSGVPVSTSTLLYVIDRMPEIKVQIQAILHRHDCTESQKVALIARLLSATSQANAVPSSTSTQPVLQS